MMYWYASELSCGTVLNYSSQSQASAERRLILLRTISVAKLVLLEHRLGEVVRDQRLSFPLITNSGLTRAACPWLLD
jgi:hypothetical protein